jgi:hypothetical protein
MSTTSSFGTLPSGQVYPVADHVPVRSWTGEGVADADGSGGACTGAAAAWEGDDGGGGDSAGTTGAIADATGGDPPSAAAGEEPWQLARNAAIDARVALARTERTEASRKDVIVLAM